MEQCSQTLWYIIVHLTLFVGHEAAVTQVYVDNHRILSCSVDGSVRGWDIKYGQGVFSFPGHMNRIVDLCYNDHLLVSCSVDSTLRFYDFSGVTFETGVNYVQKNANDLYKILTPKDKLLLDQKQSGKKYAVLVLTGACT